MYIRIRHLIQLLPALLICSPVIQAQSDRRVTASISIESYRPLLEQRIWTFSYRNQTLGHLVSLVKEKSIIDGQQAIVLQQKLELDYAAAGTERKVFIEGQHLITLDGRYMGDRKDIIINDKKERFEFTRRDDLVEGFFTREGNRFERTASMGGTEHAWDANFFDQLEILLAGYDLVTGAILTDSVYVPRTMLVEQIRGKVEGFLRVELWKNRFDSVFMIRFSEPQEYLCYFTPDKRLVRADIIGQEIRVYQDAIILPRAAPQKRTVTTAVQKQIPPASSRPLWVRIIAVIPHALSYLIFASLALLLLSRPKEIRSRNGLLAIALGFFASILILLAQTHLLEGAIFHALALKVQEGGSLLLWGLLPAILIAAVQDLSMLGSLFVLKFSRALTGMRLVYIGTIVGAAFGFGEAIYLSWISNFSLFSTAILDRGMFILFHALSGCLYGLAFNRGKSATILTFVIILLVHAFLRYLPILVQDTGSNPIFMQLLAGFVVLAMTVAAIFLLQRARTADKFAKRQ